MKLNYRDKVILVIVLEIVVLAAGIMAFVKPGIEELNEKNKTLDEVTATLKEKQEQVDKDKDLPQRIVAAKENLMKSSEIFYNKMENEDDVFEEMHALLKADNITNKNMQLTQTNIEFQDLTADPNAKAETADLDKVLTGKNDTASTAGTTTAAPAATTTATGQNNPAMTGPFKVAAWNVSCSFKDTNMEDLRNFLDHLTTNDQRTILVNSLQIKDVNNGKLEGDMQFEMIMIPEIVMPEIPADVLAGLPDDIVAALTETSQSEEE